MEIQILLLTPIPSRSSSRESLPRVKAIYCQYVLIVIECPMTRKSALEHRSQLLLVLLLVASAIPPSCFAWGNGGYSVDPHYPDYGTHDWIAQHAKNWLPATELKWIDDNLNWFLYGTEYPDNSGASYANTTGYGDTARHHNYYDTNGSITDPSAASRAQEEYAKALTELKAGRNATAAIYAGSMSHYIADMAAFGHVMTNETHHSDYEDYVGTRTGNYSYGFLEPYLVFDGQLENVSAYDASIRLGWNTFNDSGGIHTAQWMDANYAWSDPVFKDRCGESLNLATNHIADVLHTLAVAFSEGATKIPSTISCQSSPSEITEGDTITVLGSISPTISGKTVSLTYMRPDGTTVNRTATTGSDGAFSDSFRPGAGGLWSVEASWQGDLQHAGSTSQSVSFNVKKKGCIIATATYGSELSSEVQFLREFRDRLVLNTFAGSSFMEVFNAFYYSFSPSVASTISGNEALRDSMRILLYPLIGILHASATAFAFLGFCPELSVVTAGLIASALIAAVYVFPWLLLFNHFMRLRPSVKAIRMVLLILINCILTIVVSEVTVSRWLMMASTGALTLVTIALTTTILLRVIAERGER